MAKAMNNIKKIDPAPKAAASPVTAGPKPVAAGNSASIREIKPSSDQIRQRAYQIYSERIARGGNGDPQSDWLRAELELSQNPR